MDEEFLKILRCPITGDSLVEADTTLLEMAIAAQAGGGLRDRQDREVEPFSGGVIDRQARWFYPTRSAIPNLIPDQAISVEQIEPKSKDETSKAKTNGNEENANENNAKGDDANNSNASM